MQPSLLAVGPFVVASYPALLGLGACLLVWLSARNAERGGLSRQHMVLLLVVALCAGLIGARILFVAENLGRHPDPWAALLGSYPGGFVSHGALLAGVLVALAYCRVFQLPVGRMLDATAIGLAAFAAVGRLGCFAAGCCHGRPTAAAWGVVFPAGSEAAATWGTGVAIHPTQLYETAYLAAIAMWLVKSKFRFPGAKFLILVGAYSVARFLNEFLRGDGGLFVVGLTVAQWMSIVLVLITMLLFAGMQPRPQSRGTISV